MCEIIFHALSPGHGIACQSLHLCTMVKKIRKRQFPVASSAEYN